MNRRFCTLALLCVLGCGPSRSEVSGTVKYKDQVVKSGVVTFFSAVDNASYPGRINADGSYAAADIPVGKARVVVVSLDPTKKPMSETRGETSGRGSPDEKQAARPDPIGKATKDWTPLPKKYSDPSSTPLSLDVQAGKNTFNITLE